jgi:hypothetical protein
MHWRQQTKTFIWERKGLHLGDSWCSALKAERELQRWPLFWHPARTTRVATGNIRTMYLAGRNIQVAREMKSAGTETRWLRTGQLRLSSGEQLLYAVHIDWAPHTEGVAVMLAPEVQQALINSAIITAKFTTMPWCWHRKHSKHLSTPASSQPRSPPRRRTSSKTSHSAMLQLMMWRGEEKWLLAATPGRDRQERSQGRDHTDEWLKFRQDRSRQHRLCEHHRDPWAKVN